MSALLLVAAPLIGEAVDFESEVWPILEGKCVACHRAPYEEGGRTRKPKAGLRLDAAWAIAAGSENGSVLEPGDAKESELIVRVSLPPDDPDFMPPEGEADPLTEEERELLQTWIADGADFGDWEGNLEGKPAVTTAPAGAPPRSEIQEVYEALSDGLEPLDPAAWTPVVEAGGRVEPLATGSPLLSVDFRRSRETTTDETVAALSPLASHIAHLDLSGTEITGSSLELVGSMSRLVRLDLHRTGIDDTSLRALSPLENLRSLNLYGTNISDEGVTALGRLPRLEAIYLWQTEVTRDGAKRLSRSLPDAKISLR